MKRNFLFPNRFKKIGWLVFIPSLLVGLYIIWTDYEPELFNIKVVALFETPIFGSEKSFFKASTNNILDEIITILLIISLMFINFSKEKVEDEYISKLRLESLVWAIYVNYLILIISTILFYNTEYLWVMIFNMFTILIIFMIRFNWLLRYSKKI